jgi:hypothetical protein
MEFLKLLEEGCYTEALGIARSVMGPLAAKYPDLLKPLKETVLAFAKPQGESLLKPVFASGLGATLQVFSLLWKNLPFSCVCCAAIFK